MKHFDVVEFLRRELAGAAALGQARSSAHRPIEIGRLGRFLSVIARPFYKSIYVRFQYAFGLAVLGLVLMAAITFVSGRILLSTYENSVSEAQFELMPAHSLQVSLREAEHLTYLYAIEGDRSAPAHFKEVEETVNRQFQQLSENNLRFGSLHHAHSNISIRKTMKGWRDAQAAVLLVFQQTLGTKEVIDALRRAHEAIDPVYDTISAYHHGSMLDLQERLRFARSVVNRAYLSIFSAILLGLGILITMGVVVGRSVLQPIAKLQVAARNLGEKNFTHRVRLRNNRDELGQLGRAFNIASAALQRLYRELEQRSTHDGLTGALNRTAFDERLPAECKSADRHERSLSLLMVDIDFFKRVNDNFGHQAGDQVLQTVVELLTESVRPGDVVARYGGEEFAIILPEADVENAMSMADRLRKTIEGHSFNCPNGEDICITISIGCANRRPHAMAPDDLVKAADAALFQAKKTGRNRAASAETLPPASGSEDELAAA